MHQDTLFDSLLAAAQRSSITKGELMHMLDDEIARLADGARVHDYLRVIAIRRVRERIASPAGTADDAHARRSGAR
ncbi:DUF3562 domain-containing protein [Burkholderia thailandensis]|uniref:DUF3562 domain-containing protein n=2 Tax=Burkholderia thailandensis TaxID=57975 RepID=A0AAW9CUJ8_BURTH|nr:DUF3562 domain-containing protein [Burkholderia thailandensis]ABC35121.1 conserved hypothetical protein [Burkholderia thailandensis E264]AHI67046.1 hypothetical protein BTL_5569 [Burkholderia thailandensis H0587]AHI76718.1 hypothetical protein BTQ_3751 [Burkholderia thailandensis 2002721723]AHI82539.1 hypothetical protein BTJ_4783 [Burkholderia thailandensis E444]AIC90659.1 hypothetical protein BTRA_5510 [Burkholderia thailandensis USAMRU Malaysia \